MSQPRLAAIAILGLTTVTAAGFAVYQYQRAEALTAQLRDGQGTSDLNLSPKTPSPIVDAVAPSRDPEVAAVSKEIIEVESEEPEANTREARGNRGRRDMGNRIAALMSDPEYAEAFQMQQRSRLDRTYADLFAQLNLPPATLAKLQDLLIEKQNTMRDVFMAAREEGLNGRENRDELRSLVEMTQSEIDAEIAAAIGESGFETLQNYEQTGRQRALVDQLETRLSYSSAPLNSAQAQALTNILADTAPSGGGNRGGPSFGGGGGGVRITDAAINQAQAVLSPDQLQSLSALQAEQQAGQKISEAMRQETQNARGTLESGGNPRRGPGGGG